MYWLRGITGGLLPLLFMAGVIMVAVAVTYHPRSARAQPRFAILRRVGTSDVPAGNEDMHFSRVMGSFDAQGHQPWYAGISYRGCPVTSRGAVRVTVYTSPLSSRRRTQYTYAVTDWRSSDNAAYAVPGLYDTAFYYKVDILSPKGCQAWSFAGETN